MNNRAITAASFVLSPRDNDLVLANASVNGATLVGEVVVVCQSSSPT